MQARDEHNIERRALRYWNRSFSEELKKKQDYSELPKVVHIAIVNSSENICSLMKFLNQPPERAIYSSPAL
jgi:hypothetical protein